MWRAALLLLLCVSQHTAALTIASGPSPEGRFQSTPKTCPRSCRDVDSITDWTAYHEVESLAVCPEPVLLKFNLYTPFGEPGTHINIRACTLGDASTKENLLAETGYVAPDAKAALNEQPGSLSRRNLNGTSTSGNFTCGLDSPRELSVAVRLTSSTVSSRQALDLSSHVDSRSAAEAAVKALAANTQRDDRCGKNIMFAYVRGTLLGLYSGKLVDKQKSTVSVLQTLRETMKDLKESTATRQVVEMCDEHSSSNLIMGAVLDTSGDFAAVQKVIKGWNDGQCDSRTRPSLGAKIWVFDNPAGDRASLSARSYNKRQNRICRNILVEKDDTCGTLAARCGLAGFAFENYNKKTPNLCSTLKESQRVCCSSGDLPALPDVPEPPKPQPDGTCATYDVEMDEGCQAVADKHGIDMEDLFEFNKKTWGWDGCGNLWLAQRLCVSRGNPPMPASYPDATCGPTKPGTKAPAAGSGIELADLNPCPLNVCCNVWGNCGTTADFCTISKTTTGNPGTTRPGEHGCQSNCGFEMTNNDEPPAQFRKIAYFEGWNYNRHCLNMHVLDIDKSYTHVHFAFGEISDDLRPIIPPDQQEQFNAFVSAPNFPKKILAFGGWAFSNEGHQTGNFRKAFLPQNRHLFAERVVQFARDHRLAGVDFDWEYPGATDIIGSDPGQKEDGENYYQSLRLIRSMLPSEMSLSIATPASYWYLRGFPIKKMADVLDYIVYMTYDFHGQWDVGNKWSQSGCEAGNCLRSHINSTLTTDALIMITKAGVKSHKVVVGVSSYGRSFRMADGTCRGPMCRSDPCLSTRR